jgi:peptidyl-prolyl cis-trans isomerase A (cyclophilin A)
MWLLAAAVLAGSGCSRAVRVATPVRAPECAPGDASARVGCGAAPDSFLVAFETSRGRVLVAAHRSWAPLGADRFYRLVRSGSLDGAVFYRVVAGYVAQFGAVRLDSVARWYHHHTVADEPVKQGNGRGGVAFARGGPDTRSDEMYIDLADNTKLDTIQYQGVTGFPVFGRVVQGMSVVDSLYAGYGNAPLPYADSLANGDATPASDLAVRYPRLDSLRTARVLQEWRGSGS